jgi:hypothetical protein
MITNYARFWIKVWEIKLKFLINRIYCDSKRYHNIKQILKVC